MISISENQFESVCMQSEFQYYRTRNNQVMEVHEHDQIIPDESMLSPHNSTLRNARRQCVDNEYALYDIRATLSELT